MRLHPSSWRMITIAIAGALLVASLAYWAFGQQKNHPSKQGSKIAQTVPDHNWRENDFDSAASPDDCEDDTGWLGAWLAVFQAVESKTPPLAVLVGLICCVFFGPRWLRITICMVVLALAFECKWADKFELPHLSQRTCNLAGNNHPAPKALLHPN